MAADEEGKAAKPPPSPLYDRKVLWFLLLGAIAGVATRLACTPAAG